MLMKHGNSAAAAARKRYTKRCDHSEHFDPTVASTRDWLLAGVLMSSCRRVRPEGQQPSWQARLAWAIAERDYGENSPEAHVAFVKARALVRARDVERAVARLRQPRRPRNHDLDVRDEYQRLQREALWEVVEALDE